MKHFVICAAIFAASATAFAQATPSNAHAAPDAAQVASNSTSPMSQAGSQLPSHSQPVVGKTRDQVYQELMQAQKDGSLARMNQDESRH